MADATPTTALGFDNFYQGTLTGDITASSTDILIDTIPTASEGFLVIEPDSTTAREIIYYNSKTALKVVCPSAALGRGQGGTTAGAHSTGAEVIMAPVAEMFEALQNGYAMNAKAIKFNTPQGFLQNGVITPSVASNNLTLALKTLAGNDPSASDPVLVRVGNSIRTITSALSVTKNAGTNYFGSGAAGLATNEIDYFVYIGYNSTDGVTIGFARIPWATKYSDFSTTNTADTYCAISTITTAAGTDEYEVVGRFNATLSATASFNWSIPATVVVVNRPIYETRLLTYTPQVTASTTAPTLGTGGNYEQIGRYRIHNKIVDIPSMSIVFGTGGSPAAGTGNYFIQLPISADLLTPVSGTNAMGEGRMVDSSSNFSGFVFPEVETATTVQPVYYTSFTGAAAAATAATAPWTWAASDSIYRGWMRYHMA